MVPSLTIGTMKNIEGQFYVNDIMKVGCTLFDLQALL